MIVFCVELLPNEWAARLCATNYSIRAATIWFLFLFLVRVSIVRHLALFGASVDPVWVTVDATNLLSWD
jgi:hypothetical protein